MRSKSHKAPLCNFLQSFVISSSWAPHYWTPCACVVPLIWDTKCHMHKNNRNILRQQTGRQKILQAVPELNLPLISPYNQFWSVRVVPYYWTLSHFQMTSCHTVVTRTLHDTWQQPITPVVTRKQAQLKNSLCLIRLMSWQRWQGMWGRRRYKAVLGAAERQCSVWEWCEEQHTASWRSWRRLAWWVQTAVSSDRRCKC